MVQTLNFLIACPVINRFNGHSFIIANILVFAVKHNPRIQRDLRFIATNATDPLTATSAIINIP
jgi:hypothetical protein